MMSLHSIGTFVFLFAVSSMLAMGAQSLRADEPAALVNIALGKSYSFSHPPNYTLSTEPGDATDLTDGQRITDPKASFWGNKGCVGWTHMRQPLLITIDLGRVEPIGGMAYHTAAGSSSVTWPAAIDVFVSDDGEQFHPLGDLTLPTEGRLPPAYGDYTLFTFATRQLHTRGRYVQFAVRASGAYIFVDEIEVFRGAESALKNPTYAAIESIPDDLRLTRRGAYIRVRTDLESVQAMIQNQLGSGHAVVDHVAAELTALRGELETMAFPAQAEDLAAFRAVVPYHDVHRRVLGAYGKLMAGSGVKPLTLWRSDPYDMLDLFVKPRGGKVAIELPMMNGEYRAEVFNLTNASAEPRQARFNVEGLPGGTNPPYLTVYQVEYVDTREQRVVASALTPLTFSGDQYVTDVPAGMTRQIWLSFNPQDLAAGAHRGRIRVTSAGPEAFAQDIETTLTIAPMRFPQRPDLHFSLWDYVSDRAYQITDANAAAAVADMEAHWVDAVWCSPNSVPFPKPEDLDAEGNLLRTPDFSRWDAFVKLWPNARMYMAYANLPLGQPRFAGKYATNEAFTRAMSQWSKAWADHNRELGLKPGEVAVLLVDEPGSAADLTTTFAYCQAFAAGTRDILIFNDLGAEAAALPEGRRLIDISDIVCPTRANYQGLSADLQAVYRQLPQSGKQFWFYMCSGPSRMFDPGYYRYQPWHCAKEGATGSHFWAYGDAGGANNWNEYPAVGRVSYTPVYLAPDSVTISKHWQAAREGIADYQYLRMLAESVEQRRQAGDQSPRLKQAEALLESCAADVLGELVEKHTRHYEGNGANTSAIAEKARRQILAMLISLHQQ